MRIYNEFSPSFGAKLQNKVNIAKIVKGSNNYKNEMACFVKIEPENINDINTLEKISKYWADASFAINIYYAASAIRNKSKYYKDHVVFALTTQKSDFDKLDEGKVLGLIHTVDMKNWTQFIEHLQVNPKYIYKTDSEYKGIGTGIINSIKDICSKITCFPLNSKSVKDFYTKNGFYEEHEHSNAYVWYKDIMETIFRYQ